MQQVKMDTTDSGCDARSNYDGSDYISIVSYNMHGYNQGSHTVRDLILSTKPHVFLLQEHWLTPAKLSNFENDFFQYMCFGTSAMSSCVETGVFRGRPFGGVMTLVSKTLSAHSKIICASDRFVIVVVGSLLIVNVYMPSSGTPNRLFLIEEVLNNLLPWIKDYPHHTVVFGGDINCDLDAVSPVADLFNRFAADNGLFRCSYLSCNKLGSNSKISTYYNESLNCESTIDYFLVNNSNAISLFDVLDIDSNLSDHRPIIINCLCKLPSIRTGPELCQSKNRNKDSERHTLMQLRWDRADLTLYRSATGQLFQSIMNDLISIENADTVTSEIIDVIYQRIINSLLFGSNLAVPLRRKNFFKFWWDDEMDELKSKSMASCRIWKSAGKPRSGPIFDIYRKDKSAYKNGISLRRRNENMVYTNDLHDALLKKQGDTFWKCWRSKFEPNKQCTSQVDGINEPNIIAEHFALYFEKVCSNNTGEGPARLRSEYFSERLGYKGQPHSEKYTFDAELVENVIGKMKRGKAPGLDGITCEHLLFSHALLPSILAKLFNFMIVTGNIPSSFNQSYTVPIPKSSCNLYGKTVTVDDFRGVSVSPVISKVFEHCIFDRYGPFFETSDNQFGSKKNVGCANAIVAVDR